MSRIDAEATATLNAKYAAGQLHPRQPGKDFFLAFEPIAYHVRQALDDIVMHWDEMYVASRFGSIQATSFLMSMRANRGMAERIVANASESAVISQDTWESLDGRTEDTGTERQPESRITLDTRR
jgi:hypothetical protein